MTSTARRRWSRELTTQVDGIAFAAEGPVLVHGYERPPGGKWIDDVIPGKLGALDRSSGELLWMAPCEVGYGRGFGAGFGAPGQAVVLGPTAHGHRMVRVSLADGELREAADIAAFDEAHVAPDLCHCLAPRRVSALDSHSLTEAWEYHREGERYHLIARSSDRVLVVYTQLATGRQGVLALDAETGTFEGVLLAPSLPVIHGLVTTEDTFCVVTAELDRVLPRARHAELAKAIASSPERGVRDRLSLLSARVDSEPGNDPLWFRVLSTRKVEDLPEVSLQADSGKLYLERSALLEVVDALTGRELGEWTVPGLDEKVDWRVVAGAGLLAEETRVSVFELPA